MPEVVLVRHGETDWSRTGRHTGRTDIPLSALGRRQAEVLRPPLADRTFNLVLTSPLLRARDTCALAGLADAAVEDPDLMEWDYGDYEGKTTTEIRETHAAWSLWTDGCPAGETASDVGRRADRVLSTISGASGDVAIFAHGHLLRVLAARWLGLPPGDGRMFALATASVSVLGHERETPVIAQWNLTA